MSAPEGGLVVCGIAGSLRARSFDRALKRATGEADALLIATPEYNHGAPGVLKNAIDWASRPPRGSALAGKPTALLGASPGITGTARARSPSLNPHGP